MGVTKLTPIIDSKIANQAYRLLADKWAGILLSELDTQFSRHPSWKTQSDQVALIIQNFCTGASRGLSTYVTQRSIREKAAPPAAPAPAPAASFGPTKTS